MIYFNRPYMTGRETEYIRHGATIMFADSRGDEPNLDAVRESLS